MSDETQDTPEEISDSAEPKPKPARKRPRPGPAKPAAGEPAPAESAPVPPPIPADQTQASHVEERTETRTTENGTVRRVSSKRVGARGEDGEQREGRRGDGPPPTGKDSNVEETIPLIQEPPASESQGSSGKRRRRRRGGKGGQDDSRDGNEPQGGQSSPRSDIDPDLVARKAWKIFLAEVGEEGLALISDQDAKEVSRRSFRLAEIFLEEANRRG